MSVKLSPSQQEVVDRLISLLPDSNISVVWAGTGFGKTSMLNALLEQTGGALLTLKDFIERLQQRHPLAIEEALYEMMLDTMAHHDTVLVDDLNAIDDIVGKCAFHYPREGLLGAALNAICAYAIQAGKKLIFAHTGTAPEPVHMRCVYSGLRAFEPRDYEAILTHYLGGEVAEHLDSDKIHRFAPKLNAHQLKLAAQVLRSMTDLNTETFTDFLLEQRLASNVALSEVESVALHDLKGVDHVLKALETHVVVPFESSELVRELDLKPKKGVLLYGPPGTGKTTVGRALAHRLKGKFFVIDGTFISGTDSFHKRVQHVFEAAKDNAPSIIFINDSDVIWESNQGSGFYRYLLTKLDGLENQTDGMVCVMMTAMNIANLPVALIRSGRMELWLEMPLPDERARREILTYWTSKLPERMRDIDLSQLVEVTEGLTGADLRRLADDSKNLYAYDLAHGQTWLAPTDYFLQATKAVKENRRKREEAEGLASPAGSGGRGCFDYDSGEEDECPPG